MCVCVCGMENENVNNAPRSKSMLDKQVDILPVEDIYVPAIDLEIGNNNTNENIKTTGKRLSTLRRLSRWFVSHQKTDTWDRNRLNMLHIVIITLLLIMYICHIVGRLLSTIVGKTQ